MIGDDPLLSVVIPALDEAGHIEGVLEDLGRLAVATEILVVDGGSRDHTREIARAAGATVVPSAPGRGIQLRAGAAAARGALLCFLHADARLPLPAVAALERLARNRPARPHVFTLEVAAPGLPYRLIEAGANFRSRFLHLPYGDQGLVIRRSDYDRAGGYPAYPLMEDVALIRSLRATTTVAVLDAAIRVSPRRWRREGVLRRTVRNQLLLLRFLTGTDPDRLVRSYRPEGRQ